MTHPLRLREGVVVCSIGVLPSQRSLELQEPAHQALRLVASALKLGMKGLTNAVQTSKLCARGVGAHRNVVGHSGLLVGRRGVLRRSGILQSSAETDACLKPTHVLCVKQLA